MIFYKPYMIQFELVDRTEMTQRVKAHLKGMLSL